MEKTSNKFITFYKKFGIYVFLVAVVIIFSIIAPNFLSVANLINILRQVSIFGIVVIGVTMVMIGGGMDLSVGGIMAVVGMVMGYCMVNVGLPIPVAVIIGIALGVAFGAINGVVAIKLHIAPIIVTLAMMLVLQGVAYLITGGYPITGMPKAFLTVGQGYIGPVPIPVILFVIFIVFGWIVMNKTGLLISISGSFAVPDQSAAAASRIPGDVAPEWNTPPSNTRSCVVAVPKSTTITGPPYNSYAATASTRRSAPSVFGSGIAILIPVLMPGATIIG